MCVTEKNFLLRGASSELLSTQDASVIARSTNGILEVTGTWISRRVRNIHTASFSVASRYTAFQAACPDGVKKTSVVVNVALDLISGTARSLISSAVKVGASRSALGTPDVSVWEGGLERAFHVARPLAWRAGNVGHIDAAGVVFASSKTRIEVASPYGTENSLV